MSTSRGCESTCPAPATCRWSCGAPVASASCSRRSSAGAWSSPPPAPAARPADPPMEPTAAALEALRLEGDPPADPPVELTAAALDALRLEGDPPADDVVRHLFDSGRPS